ncbi:hypothetical protein KIM372_11690 [Bombiscardovia nodaiensis]|uniref:RCC1-like domain-containing protein n=1 Tax=Bombiscardovia nodaiensis TaxID=2932181 RepID=A0ABM8B8Y6_9BIFI|nr:hypothetical protein KIM372_11690 [Bombiscardovia nodaiensis]
MRRIHTTSVLIALALVMTLGVSTGFLSFPEPVHADQGNPNFYIEPSSGPVAGGTQVIIKPYTAQGVNFVQVDSKWKHTLALGSDGKAYAWGDNQFGELGDGTTVQRLKPVRVSTPAGVKFVKVQAGGGVDQLMYKVGYQSLALTDNGRIYSWGHNYSGELGLGNNIDQSTPQLVPMPAGVNKFTDILTIWGASFGLADNGKVYAWGDGGTYYTNGQLGLASTARVNTPTAIFSIPDTVRIKQISGLGHFVMALGDNGTIYTWGNNDYGQLGQGHTDDRNQAVIVRAPDGSNFTSVSAGGYNAYATTSSGKTYNWGPRDRGQFGDGTGDFSGPIATYEPRPVESTISMPPGVSIRQISRGGWHTLVIGSDNKAYSWGYNKFGALGNNTCVGTSGNCWTITPKPISVPDGVTFTSVTAGYWNSFAIGSDGNSYGWGSNEAGTVGNGSIYDVRTPVRIGGKINITNVSFDGLAPTAGVSNGDTGSWTGRTPPHASGWASVRVDWTLNGISQPPEYLRFRYLGDFTVTFKPGNPGGANFSQAVHETYFARYPTPNPTWLGHAFTGWYLNGKLYDFGTPVTSNITLTGGWALFSMTPTSGPVSGGTDVIITPPPGLRFTQVAAGVTSGLAIGNDGKTYAWGVSKDTGWWHEAYYDSITNVHASPALVQVNSPVQLVRVSAGLYHSLGLGVDGRVYAWGSNRWGQLGTATNSGTAVDTPNPVAVPLPAGKRFTAVSAGALHSLALADDGTVYSWGTNYKGALGNGAQDTDPHAWGVHPTPTPVSTSVRFQAISAGKLYSLALSDNGTLYGWGDNDSGQLGTPAGSDPTTPTASSSTVRFTSIAAGQDHSMGLTADGTAYGWGNNGNGQIGTGSASPTSITTPTAVNTSMKFKSISPGGYSTLAVAADGTAYSWGANNDGQLGIGALDSNPHLTPTAVSSSRKFSAVAGNDEFEPYYGGNAFGLGLSEEGDLFAWGSAWDWWIYEQSTPTLLEVPKPQLTSVKFGTAPNSALGINLHFNDSGPNPDFKWHVTTPPHQPDELVDVTIEWTLAGVQQNPVHFNFLYYALLNMPKAGALPLQRVNGSLLLSLAATASALYAAYQLAQRRKRTRRLIGQQAADSR